MYPGELPFPGLDVTTKDARTKLGLQKKKKRKAKKSQGQDIEAILKALNSL